MGTGSCIEPHIDDCWIWGERIVQLNLLSSSFLTLFPAHLSEESKRYNLPDVDTYPKILDPVSQSVLFNPFDDKLKNTAQDVEHCVLREDIVDRRIVVAYREFTPTYLPGGREEDFGKGILKTSENFWG